MDFRGLGTATYNNSIGTSNGITLGSTSNLVVSNSLSASKEYTGTTSALVQRTGEGASNYTNFLQTIGSSTGAANMQAAARWRMSPVCKVSLYCGFEGNAFGA